MSIVVPEYLSVALGVVEYAAIWRDWGNVRPYIFSVGWSSRQSHTEIAVVAGLTPCSSVSMLCSKTYMYQGSILHYTTPEPLAFR